MQVRKWVVKARQPKSSRCVDGQSGDGERRESVRVSGGRQVWADDGKHMAREKGAGAGDRDRKQGAWVES